MPIAQIVGQPATCFRDNFQCACHSIEMQTSFAEFLAGQTFDKFAGEQDIVPNVIQGNFDESECINGFALGDRPHMGLERDAI